MMFRWIATAIIALLFILNMALPSTSIGRRGTEAEARRDYPGQFGEIGDKLPRFHLVNIDGESIRSTDLLGHKLLLIFERSVDW